jgi:hypothetical protein
MRRNTGLLIAALAAVAFTGCKSLGGMPGGGGNNVDPEGCGGFAGAADVGAKIKVFLTAIKDLDTETQRLAGVVKESCVTMGKELGMADADLAGDDTKAVCGKVVTAYQENLKVGLKAGAKLTVNFSPGSCKVDASAAATMSGGCQGAAGTGGVDGACQASAKAEAAIHVECTPPSLTLEASAGVIVDKSKVEMTLKAMRDGLPKILDVGDRAKPLAEAIENVVKAAADLKDAGGTIAKAFGKDALCVTGQLAAAVSASAHIQANVNISVSVSASASGSVAGNAGG